MTAPDRDRLILACETLIERDAALAKAYALHGLPDWRIAPATYSTLARTVAFQQISLAAAGAIWARVLDHFDGVAGLTPAAVLEIDDAAICACGMSRPKTAYMKSIARAITSGVLDLDRVVTAPIADARRELLAVKGIGPWTAEIFLLYTGALDAFPVGDIGLLNAYQSLRGDVERMRPAAFTTAAKQWQPYRGAAAHLLWAHFHAMRTI